MGHGGLQVVLNCMVLFLSRASMAQCLAAQTLRLSNSQTLFSEGKQEGKQVQHEFYDNTLRNSLTCASEVNKRHFMA